MPELLRGKEITLEKKTNTNSKEALKFKILLLPSTFQNGMAIESRFISTDLAPIKASSACHPQCTQAPGCPMNSSPAFDRRVPGDGKKTEGKVARMPRAIP